MNDDYFREGSFHREPTVPANRFHLVHQMQVELEPRDGGYITAQAEETACDRAFTLCQNIVTPWHPTERSMSVGDLVITKIGPFGAEHTFRCDSFGWSEVTLTIGE